MMSATVRKTKPADTALHHYLRTGRRGMPLELKYNHNHDAETGQFTSADGAGDGTREGRGEGKGRSFAIAPPSRQALADGPFRSAARRQDRVGALAREANSFVQRRTDRLVVPLTGIAGNLTITRGAGDAVNIDNRFFSTHGHLSVTPGLQEIVVTLAPPVGKLGTSFTSFPSHLRLFQSVTGKINYSIDRDLTAKPIVGKADPIRRGTYLGLDK